MSKLKHRTLRKKPYTIKFTKLTTGETKTKNGAILSVQSYIEFTSFQVEKTGLTVTSHICNDDLHSHSELHLSYTYITPNHVLHDTRIFC